MNNTQAGNGTRAKPGRIATVGQLRAALEGIPDDTPLIVNAADPDYPNEAVTEQVITNAGFGLIDWGDGYGLEPSKVFGLDCEFGPPGWEMEPRPVRPSRRTTAGTALSAEPEAGL